MIAATALELLLIGLAVWQLVAVRRSLRADQEAERRAEDEPPPADKSIFERSGFRFA